MKRSKKAILIFLGIITLTLAVSVLYIGLQVAPTVNHALRISELLQPVIGAKNQSMHIGISSEFAGKKLDMESKIYLVTEDADSYLAIEQNGTAVYIADNVLFLENGKAFKLGDAMQPRTASYKELLPYIGSLYEALKITATETDSEITYSVTVTGEQVKTLLEAASLGEALPAEGIRELQLQLTEKHGKLDRIVFSGSGNADKAAVTLHATLSGFRVLAAGDYPIPEVVKQSAATVNRSELFSLTEDLYRLVLALAPFADMGSVEGTLGLRVDCGLLQLDTQMKLSDLQTTSGAQLDPEKIQTLPEMVGLLCMEGDISCQRKGDVYVYTLVLDQTGMEELARMILPELAQYGRNFTEGSISVILENSAVASMGVSIEGKIPALVTQIPVKVAAEFEFDEMQLAQRDN